MVVPWRRSRHGDGSGHRVFEEHHGVDTGATLVARRPVLIEIRVVLKIYAILKLCTIMIRRISHKMMVLSRLQIKEGIEGCLLCSLHARPLEMASVWEPTSSAFSGRRIGYEEEDRTIAVKWPG